MHVHGVTRRADLRQSAKVLRPHQIALQLVADPQHLLPEDGLIEPLQPRLDQPLLTQVAVLVARCGDDCP